jgi:hypothetical protein
MIRNFGRKLPFASALAIGLLAVIPAHAQSARLSTAAPLASSEFSPVYDLSKEIIIQGTIQKIETVTSPGLLGNHLQLQTPQGVVDAHLGAGAVANNKTLGLTIGQSVRITGMLADIGGASVFLARVLTTSNHIYILRNERGLPARAIMPRGNASSPHVQKGGN